MLLALWVGQTDVQAIDSDSALNRVIAEFCRARGFKLSDYTLSIQARQMDTDAR